MLKKIIFIILLINMPIDKAISYQDDDVSHIQEKANLDIDWSLIEKLEGNEVFGHQPTANSGVTIGSGFDLKEKTESSLKDMGFDPDLIDKLKPYLGLTGDEAAAVVNDKNKDLKNLVLSSEETSRLNKLSKKHYTEDIKNQYEEGTGKKFNKLSPEQQTIVMSVGYQYGNLKTRTPNFWKGVINDDWTGVVNELNNFGDEHDTRREEEAKYLSASLD